MSRSTSLFSGAQDFVISGGEFNAAGRNLVNHRLDSSAVASESYTRFGLLGLTGERDGRRDGGLISGLNRLRSSSVEMPLNSSTSYPVEEAADEDNGRFGFWPFPDDSFASTTDSSTAAPRSPIHNIYGGEINNTNRDHIKVTVVNVLGTEGDGSNISAMSPSNISSSLINTSDLETEVPRPGTGDSVSSGTSSSSRGVNSVFDGDISRFRSPMRSQDRITMTSVQDSQRCLELYTQDDGYTNICDLYTRLMLPKAQGFPLWSPSPSSGLPMEYKREGVRIGDVGLVTSDGAFDFLFNVFLPANDPINPSNLYPEFEPLTLLNERDLDIRPQFDQGSSIKSGKVRQLASNNGPPGIPFQYAGSQGAVLVFPDGATSIDARNKSIFRDYAAVNAERWYRYANGTRARDAPNNTLYLVTGCIKSESWGISAFEGAPSNGNSLKLCVHFHEQAQERRPSYYWQSSGSAISRAYPHTSTVFNGNNDSDGRLNQCLFLRGYRICLQEENWTRLFSPAPLPIDASGDDERLPPFSDKSTFPNGSGNAKTSSKTLKSFLSKVFKGRQSSILFPKQVGIILSSATDMTQANSISPVRNEDSQKLHPSYIINYRLLEKVPTASAALVHDDDWCSNIIDSESLDIELCTKVVLEKTTIVHENGAVFLEPKAVIYHDQAVDGGSFAKANSPISATFLFKDMLRTVPSWKLYRDNLKRRSAFPLPSLGNNSTESKIFF